MSKFTRNGSRLKLWVKHVFAVIIFQFNFA